MKRIEVTQPEVETADARPHQYRGEADRHLSVAPAATVVARAVDDFGGSAPIALRALLRGEAVVRVHAALRMAEAGEWCAGRDLLQLAVDFLAEVSAVEVEAA